MTALYETMPAELRPQFVLEEEPQWNFVETEFQTGDVQVRPRDHLPQRSWIFRWNVGTQDELEILKAFVNYHTGAKTPFYWEPENNNPIPRPYIGPVIETKDGGVLTSTRTLYVAHTWSDGTNETTPSCRITSVDLAAHETIVVTTQAFPENVTEARIYVGLAAVYSQLKLQSPAIYAPDSGWAEPTTGYDTGGAAPPTTNTLVETPLVYASDDSFTADRIDYRAHLVSLRVTEKRGG